MDDVEAVDLVQCGVQIGLNGKMGHDDQRYGAFLGRVVSRIVLDQAGDADPALAQNLSQLPQHAGSVCDGKSQIIAGLDLTGGSKRQRRKRR